MVHLKAFNPLVPGDSEVGGLLVAILSYEVSNRSAGEIQVSVCGSMRNFIGGDTRATTPDWRGERRWVGAPRNLNRFRTGSGFQGIFLDSQGVDPSASGWGTMALVTEKPDGVSFRTV